MTEATGILAGLRVVEVAAFVAAPLCGMLLAQHGADVIRIDPIGGGADFHRWPVTESGTSLYWAGLNKAKCSVSIDLRGAEGREIAVALITASGEEAGILTTNLPSADWLSYDALSARRPDLIYLHVLGNPDGGAAVDYTVNCAVGLPFVTGDAGPDRPVNHVLPAWDLVTGALAATALLAAERQRRLTGKGQHIRLPLSDVALAMVGALGHIAETMASPRPREAHGNYLYGAFGRDFPTADGRRIMVVALTTRQWRSLVAAAGIEQAVEEIERRTGLDLDDEGDRFRARVEIATLLEAWCGGLMLAQAAAALDRAGACWGPYQTFRQMVAEDGRCSPANPLFQWIEQAGVGPVMAPASPVAFAGFERPVRPAPSLGEHTDEVLAAVLGLSDGAIGDLRRRKIVA